MLPFCFARAQLPSSYSLPLSRCLSPSRWPPEASATGHRLSQKTPSPATGRDTGGPDIPHSPTCPVLCLSAHLSLVSSVSACRLWPPPIEPPATLPPAGSTVTDLLCAAFPCRLLCSLCSASLSLACPVFSFYCNSTAGQQWPVAPNCASRAPAVDGPLATSKSSLLSSC
uniref:Uncharacterized protein n=1 Tax=Opuntia streptacantha TaxID=393608 RepID=A0A7C8ZFC2_OPUST